MGIYKEEAIRIAPMYYTGCETHEEKEILTCAIENALRWGGFKKSIDKNKSYFSGYSPIINLVIVSNALGIPVSSILEGLVFSNFARKAICYISSKDNDIKIIADLFRCPVKKAFGMVNSVQLMVDAKDGYTICMLEKIQKEIQEYKSKIM